MPILNLPPWASAVVIRSIGSGLYHKRSGWNAFKGYRTACGRTIKNVWEEFAVAEFSLQAIAREYGSENTGLFTICKRCEKKEVVS